MEKSCFEVKCKSVFSLGLRCQQHTVTQTSHFKWYSRICIMQTISTCTFNEAKRLVLWPTCVPNEQENSDDGWPFMPLRRYSNDWNLNAKAQRCDWRLLHGCHFLRFSETCLCKSRSVPWYSRKKQFYWYLNSESLFFEQSYFPQEQMK